MAGASGQFGKIQADSSTLFECTQWSFTREIAEQVYASCSTSGYRARVKGTEDVTGTAEGVLDPSAHVFDQWAPGDVATLKLYFTAAKYHEIAAMNLSHEETCNIEDGEVIRWSIPFGLDAKTATPSWNQS